MKTANFKSKYFSCINKVSPKQNKNPFSTKESFVDNEHDPDVNFYRDISMFNTQYLMPDKYKINFKDFSKYSFSILQLNIKSMNKSFESFSECY